MTQACGMLEYHVDLGLDLNSPQLACDTQTNNMEGFSANNIRLPRNHRYHAQQYDNL
jgi:hypothetical protein